MMIDEWRIRKEVEGSSCGLILKYYSGICLEELKKTTKDLSQDSRSPDRDFNPGPPEYEAGMLTMRFGHALKMTMLFFHVVTQCRHVGGYQHFEVTYCLMPQDL
jgi:hypothetical protein